MKCQECLETTGTKSDDKDLTNCLGMVMLEMGGVQKLRCGEEAAAQFEKDPNSFAGMTVTKFTQAETQDIILDLKLEQAISESLHEMHDELTVLALRHHETFLHAS